METQDWLLTAGQGLIVALFLGFFWLVIRLWLHLARSPSAYNSTEPVDCAQGSEAAEPSKHKTITRSGGGT